MYVETEYAPAGAPERDACAGDSAIAGYPEGCLPLAWDDPAAPDDPACAAGDRAVFSEAAKEAFRQAAIEPIKNGTFSLDQLERRINVVRGEIDVVWNSALPRAEKDRQISAKENEIALLQAGQYAFAKAGFPLSV
ncbi:MAG: hypothetical protein V3571_15520 [Pseudodesulfovibrio sp.]